MCSAQGAGSPRLLSFDSNTAFARHAVMCLKYIDGPFEPLDTAHPDRIAESGSIVRRAHRMPVDTLAPILSAAPDLAAYIDDRRQSMLARMSLVRDPLPTSTQDMFNSAAKWAKHTADRLRAFDDDGALVLLHADVSAANMLWTPRPVLIDWEYARIGDPADEIGYLFGQNALPTEQRDAYLDFALRYLSRCNRLRQNVAVDAAGAGRRRPSRGRCSAEHSERLRAWD